MFPERSGANNKGVSITFHTEWMEPRDPENQDHWDAAIRAIQFKLGWFAHPIFIDGDYPEIMKSKF